jgi:glycine hydroxymethyltransferase
MKKEGFNVLAEEFDFTESHQIAVDVREYVDGKMVTNLLKENDIILNMNILPYEPLRNVTNPDGIRIKVQKVTRFGMKEQEMEVIARLIRECIIEGREVREEVSRFRSSYTSVRYSFDGILKELGSPNLF